MHQVNRRALDGPQHIYQDGKIYCIQQLIMSRRFVPLLMSLCHHKSFTCMMHFLPLQVPLSLAIRISSVRGTLRIHLKPPPSDQIWYGFTSMPDLEWDLESSVGDRKITNSHISTLIGYRFKVLSAPFALTMRLLLQRIGKHHTPQEGGVTFHYIGRIGLGYKKHNTSTIQTLYI